jgi:hypothetical protein
MKLLTTAVLALALCAQASACGGTMNAVNMVATPQVKALLQTAYVRATGEANAPLVAGRTYYGYHVGIHFAVATFARPGERAYPAILTDDGLGKWRLMRVTHGGICAGVVPADLIRLWSLAHWRGGCFVEAAA